MIARTVDPNATLDQYWTTKTGAKADSFAALGISLSNTGAFNRGSVVNPDSTTRLNAKDGDGKTAMDQLGAGKPVIIGGDINSRGSTEAHWMLGVGKDGTKIIANDPWTGTRVKIETQGANQGTVTEIMNPKTGVFYSLSDVINGKLSQKTQLEFNSLPSSTSGPSYNALNSFNAAGTHGGFVTVSFKSN
jgi:hypothetical protein